MPLDAEADEEKEEDAERLLESVESSLSALSLMAPISLLLATVYMVLVILDVIEEDFLSGRLPRSNRFLDALALLPRQFLSKFLPMPGDDDNDPPFAAPT